MTEVSFEPAPLKKKKKGKKIFAFFLSIIWIGVIVIVVWGMQIQSSDSKEIINSSGDDLIEVKDADGGSQLPSNGIRIDEILGSTIYDDITGSDQQTGNPMDSPGSVDELLEGKEIEFPE